MTTPTPPERDALSAEAEARHQRLRESFRMGTSEWVEITGALSENDLYVAAMMDCPKLLAQLRADAEEIARLRNVFTRVRGRDPHEADHWTPLTRAIAEELDRLRNNNRLDDSGDWADCIADRIRLLLPHQEE